MKGERTLVVDANVLIDYLEADSEVLLLLTRHFAVVCVPVPVLEEVAQLTPVLCDHLGLRIVLPDADEIAEAVGLRDGLSFEDATCLVMARRRGWTCVSNDKRLRSECAHAGVPVVWGLEVMLNLIEQGNLASKDAIQIAWKINANNP